MNRNSLSISTDGINLIKSFDGCRLIAYKDSVNVLTIGWGHTGADVLEKQEISQEQADTLLQNDLNKVCASVNNLIKVLLSQNKMDALVSFTFNLGSGNLGSSTLLRLINMGAYNDASKQFIRWNKAGGKVLDGLTRRRKAEQALFNGADWTVFKK